MEGALERVMEWHATVPCAGVLCKPLWLWRLTLHPPGEGHRVCTLLVPGHGIIHRGRGKQANGAVQDETLKTRAHPGPTPAVLGVRGSLGATALRPLHSDRATAGRVRYAAIGAPVAAATHSAAGHAAGIVTVFYKLRGGKRRPAPRLTLHRSSTPATTTTAQAVPRARCPRRSARPRPVS